MQDVCSIIFILHIARFVTDNTGIKIQTVKSLSLKKLWCVKNVHCYATKKHIYKSLHVTHAEDLSTRLMYKSKTIKVHADFLIQAFSFYKSPRKCLNEKMSCQHIGHISYFATSTWTLHVQYEFVTRSR